MKNLFEKSAVEEIENRINQLTPVSQRQWGKMNVDQMLAHCSAALEVAVGMKSPPRIFIGKILGPIVKSNFLGPKPYPKNSPTDKSFIIQDSRDFEKEKQRLLNLIHQFSAGGDEKVTKHPHSFVGKLTPAEWSRSMYKHLDHHLHQFNV